MKYNYLVLDYNSSYEIYLNTTIESSQKYKYYILLSIKDKNQDRYHLYYIVYKMRAKGTSPIYLACNEYFSLPVLTNIITCL